jgi:hypothetical protein
VGQILERTIKEHAHRPWPPPAAVYDQLKFTIDGLSREVHPSPPPLYNENGHPVKSIGVRTSKINC